jgi:ArsR family transcriptional regulator, arsenate/arsenite/antimonite-responsive transcriptional repressor
VSPTTLPDVARAARWFHALSDETRLEIARLLSHGERCVCELQDALDAAQSRLSFHLKTLKQAGLVNDRREGRWVYYTLNHEALDEIAAFTTSVKPGRHAGSCRTACCEGQGGSRG